MLRLNIPREPSDIELQPGVTLTVRPLTSAVLAAARHQARTTVAALREEAESGAVPAEWAAFDLADPAVQKAVADVHLATALGTYAIIAWTGVLDDATSEPAPVTPDTVTALMCVAGVPELFLERYTASEAEIAAEGNASGASPSGISATAPPTAATAATPAPPAPRD